MSQVGREARQGIYQRVSKVGSSKPGGRRNVWEPEPGRELVQELWGGGVKRFNIFLQRCANTILMTVTNQIKILASTTSLSP